MHLGLATFMTDEAAHPATVARLVEATGVLESLWVTEHTHIPVNRQTPYPAGGELPREYTRMHDPFVALSFAAAVTSRIRLATGLCLPAQRDPIVLAKEAATLDALSGGRLVLGVGAGWNEEEMRNHGTDPRARFKLLRERVEAIRQIWTEDEAEYHGELVDFDPVWSWPKPVQRPHPPVLLGGNGPRVLDRVLRYADGWVPIHYPGTEDDQCQRIALLRERAEAEGRPRPEVTLYAAPRNADAVRWWQDAGIDRCVWMLPPSPEDEIEQAIERLADLAAQVDD